MLSEQRIRAVLFYLSVFIFVSGLPFILSFSLGYKFDPRTIKFTRTGLIFVKTQPQGASVYLDKKLLDEKTPLAVRELLPGDYALSIELDKHYSWRGQANVEAGKVTRIDKVILFPRRSNVTHLNKEKVSSFLLDDKKAKIYYVNEEEKIIYTSNLDGDDFLQIGVIPEMNGGVKKLKLSQDREKLICFNSNQIAVISLNKAEREDPFVLDYHEAKIIDAFWHSDNYHIIIVTEKNIEVRESQAQSIPVDLVNLNKKYTSSFYDENKGVLYFIDSQKAADGKSYDNVYKLELGTKFFQLQDLIKRKQNEEDKQN